MVLVMPGLNNRPEAMRPIVETLNDNGYRSRIIPLRFGQTLGPAAIAEDWVSSLAAAYNEARARADEPLHCVAYSLGAIVTLMFLQHTPNAFFERLFLIAPPLALTRSAGLVRLLTPFYRLGWSLPSLAPKEIRVRSTTTMADYQAMLTLIDHLNAASLSDNIRRIDAKLVLIAHDELVAAKGVEDWIKKRGLQWQLLRLQSGPQPRHLLLSELRTGSAAWRSLTHEMIGHFTSHSTVHG
jgi:pimeloyl-ACP methyl ester carboxylesterase